MKRPLSKMVPASVTNHTKPLSGAVCEDILNLTEVVGLLTLLPGFEEHERELLHASEGSSSSPGIMFKSSSKNGCVFVLPQYSRFVIGLLVDCDAPKM